MNSFETSDLLVLSHLRWNFVFQRPQHLMSRFARHRRVYFVEPPVKGDVSSPMLHQESTQEGVEVLVPHVPAGLEEEAVFTAVAELLRDFVTEENLIDFTAWYYNPMALKFTPHLEPTIVVFDCMDELTGFRDCPQEMRDWESRLLEAAHVVFTGGHSIYEAKKHRHHNIHPFPSSIDHEHFRSARQDLVEPQDQINIPHPRIGFYGVIEERIDLKLLEEIALLRPDYQFIMVGPVIRIDEEELPRLPNIHYLGKKDYNELPLYLAGWDCAMMPFALNEATRFISPTKTPEFLAAGKPVVSTPINDVVHPYGEAGFVHIAETAEEFVTSLDVAMYEKREDPLWQEKVDEFLQGNSWETTFHSMALQERSARETIGTPILRRSQVDVVNVNR